ncbi:MAG: SdpI family protein [Coriobacteriia bacterium]|nr:SdpI family protein [Coriobacteriia bacterium]MCL2750803.1 SdpI family protein [Coriobacteriia bacterium]
MAVMIVVMTTNAMILALSLLTILKFSTIKINMVIGYRTPKSMASAEAWKSANKRFGQVLLAASCINTVVLVLLSIIIPVVYHEIVFTSFLALVMVEVVLAVAFTERFLAKKFQNTDS